MLEIDFDPFKRILFSIVSIDIVAEALMAFMSEERMDIATRKIHPRKGVV